MTITVSLITTCRGRLHHLRQTLPMMVAQGADEVIVVDYGCPDGAGDWVAANFPSVRVVRAGETSGYAGALARNLGGQAARSDWVVFIDGDVETAPGWVDWMRASLVPGSFYRAAPIDGLRDPETWGTVICARADYQAIGGFDEAFFGWGGEDTDFYQMLAARGLAEAEYPHRFVHAIPHPDAERAGWGGMRDRDEKLVVNASYREAKMRILEALAPGTILPLDKRRAIMDQIVRELRKWFDAGAPGPLALRCGLRRGPALRPSSSHVIQSELTVTVHVSAAPARQG